MTPKGNETQQAAPQMDWLKWLVIFLIVAAGVVVNFYFRSTAWPIRAAIGILVTVALLFIAFYTAKGQKAWEFIKGARAELRKVSWPSRHETVQTTMIVVVVVVITALVLWGIDSFFMWLISWLTGQRG